jgi:hypothetical protein
MLAEKAADQIAGRAPLRPLEVPVYIAPQWKTASADRRHFGHRHSLPVWRK